MPERPSSRLFNASGRARELRASALFAIGPSEPWPALRRGALLAVPIGLALVVELGFGAPTQGAIAAGQRATGTVLGIAIAFLARRLWPNPRGAVDLAGQPTVGGVNS